MTSLISQH